MNWICDLRLAKLGPITLILALAFLCHLGSVSAQPPADGPDELQFDPEAKTAFDAGVAALRAEPPNLEEAARQLQSAIDIQAAKKRPPLAQAYLELGLVYLRLEEFEKAVTNLLPVTRAATNSPIAFIGLGHAYVELDEFGAAIEALSTAQSLSRQPNSDILYWRGRAQAAIGEYEIAMNDFSDALSINRNDKRIFGAIGSAQLQLGNYDSAIKSLNRAIEMDQADETPNAKPFATAYADLGRTYAQTGDIEKALENLEQAVELARDAGDAEDEREFASDFGSVQQQDENFAGAVATFTRVIELAQESDDDQVKNDPIPHIVRAMSYVELGNSLDDEAASHKAYTSAVADCDASIEMDPRIAGAHFQRGIALRMLEAWHDAIDAFSHAIELDPRISDAYLRRGIVWFYQGEYDIAAADFDDSIRLSIVPATSASLWKGFVHAQKGEYLAAINAYSDVIRDQPQSVTAFHNRALAYIGMKEYDRAIADLNTAIRMDAKDKLAYYRRGVALSRKGEDAQAIDSYSAAIRLDDTFAKGFFNRSIVHRRLGNTKQAEDDLARAQQLDPKLR